MKKSLLLLLPLILGLSACSSQKKDKPDWGEVATKTIVFKGEKNRSGLTSGSQLGTAAFNSALTNLVNEQTDNSLGHRMGILGCSTAEMKMSLGC